MFNYGMNKIEEIIMHNTQLDSLKKSLALKRKSY